MRRFACFLILALLLFVSSAQAARETIFGLEKVVIEGVYDPNAPTERMLLVSGSLKLVGMGRSGNTWQTVTYIPRRTAVPRSDHGVFQRIGNTLVFYSYITFKQFSGEIQPDGERVIINRFGNGKRQRETWYLVRGGDNL